MNSTIFKINFLPENENLKNGYLMLNGIRFTVYDQSNDDFYYIKSKELIKKIIYILHSNIRNLKTNQKLDIDLLKRKSEKSTCLDMIENCGFKRSKCV